MKMVERIKLSAAKQGLTLAQLEQRLGFGVRTIYRWDQSSPSVDKVLAVANLLHVSLYWLVTGTYENSSQPFAECFELLSDGDKEKIRNFMEICLAGSENGTASDHARQSADSPQHIADSPQYIADSLRYIADSPRPQPAETFQIPVLGRVSEYAHENDIHCLGYSQSSFMADYALIMGDSDMEPLIYPGEYIFLKNEKVPSNGDIVVLRRNRRLMCRQFLKDPNRFVLRSLTRRTEAETLSQEEFSDTEIVGRVLLNQRQQDMMRLFFNEKI